MENVCSLGTETCRCFTIPSCAMTKSRGWKPQSADSSKQNSKPRTKIHVPIVHGIGEVRGEAWAQRSVSRLYRWWSTNSKLDLRPVNCTDCILNTDHVHIEVGADHEVILDPVLWGDRVADVGIWGSFRWLSRTALTIWLINVVAAMSVLANWHNEVKIFKSVMQGIYSLVGLVMRAILVLPLAIMCSMLLLAPSGRTKIVHAMSWVGPGIESRGKIAESVARSINSVPASHRVLIGHSQGGSILAFLCKSNSISQAEQLITIGSGHGLLATASVALSVRRSYLKSFLLSILFILVTVTVGISILHLLSITFISALVVLQSTAKMLSALLIYMDLIPMRRCAGGVRELRKFQLRIWRYSQATNQWRQCFRSSLRRRSSFSLLYRS